MTSRSLTCSAIFFYGGSILTGALRAYANPDGFGVQIAVNGNIGRASEFIEDARRCRSVLVSEALPCMCVLASAVMNGAGIVIPVTLNVRKMNSVMLLVCV